MARKYGQWVGNPKGRAEDKTRCIEEVFSGLSPGGYQCQRKRGYGPRKQYCKQHANMIEKARSELRMMTKWQMR